MMNLVGELVLTRNQMLQSDMAAANFPELARRLDSVTADLRETVMQARMQPMGNLFGKFPRMVRDLARTCGRNVRIEFYRAGDRAGQESAGGDQGSSDPRREKCGRPWNRITRSVRVLAGKPAEGCVRLKAFHQGGSVVIEVLTMAREFAMERVLEKAIERNLVTAEQAADMSEREVLQLIFLPGFSTAAAVTTVSGRGVGMDVVRANVEKVGGSVEVESRRGEGTTLRLRVPLTLAIVPSLVVRSGGQMFRAAAKRAGRAGGYSADGSSRSRCSESVRRSSTACGSVCCRWYGWTGCLVWSRICPRQAQGHYLAVLEADGCRYGLVVDELMSPEEIVVKPLSPVLREIGLFSGATVLGNGTLAFILDVGATAARAGVKPIEERERRRSVQARWRYRRQAASRS